MQLLWLPEADRVMTRIKADGSLRATHYSVRRILGRLEFDPFDRGLRTRQFSTEMYGQVRCTPVVGDWCILWKSGPGPDEITIVFVAEAAI